MDTKQNRISYALNLKNIKQVELAEKTGLSPAQINSWKNNRWQPKQTALHKMAKVLDVSELWLAGYDVPMIREPEQKKRDKITELSNLLKSDSQIYNLVIQITELSSDNLSLVEQLINTISRR